jgi:hypothetical protein
LYAFILAYLGWILFRANSMNDVAYILRNMFNFSQGFADLTEPFDAGLLPQRIEFMVSFILIGGLMLADGIAERLGLMATFSRLSWQVRWFVYYGLILCIYVSLFYDMSTQTFIYFQF